MCCTCVYVNSVRYLHILLHLWYWSETPANNLTAVWSGFIRQPLLVFEAYVSLISTPWRYMGKNKILESTFSYGIVLCQSWLQKWHILPYDYMFFCCWKRENLVAILYVMYLLKFLWQESLCKVAGKLNAASHCYTSNLSVEQYA